MPSFARNDKHVQGAPALVHSSRSHDLGRGWTWDDSVGDANCPGPRYFVSRPNSQPSVPAVSTMYAQHAGFWSHACCIRNGGREYDANGT